MGRLNAIGAWFEKIVDGFIFGTVASKLTLRKNIEAEGTDDPIKYVHSFQSKNGVVAHLDDIPQLVGADRVLEGGKVTWTGTGYVYDISNTVLQYSGQIIQVPGDSITLSPPDSAFDRIDIIAVSPTGYLVIEGTPSANPVEAQAIPPDQFRLTSITVNAGSSNPANPLQNIIYAEGVEWTGSTTGVGTVDYLSTIVPATGSNAISVSDCENGFVLTMDYGSELNLDDFNLLSMKIYLRAELTAGFSMGYRIKNGSGIVVGNFVPITFVTTATNEYQNVGVATSTFQYSGNFRYVELLFLRTKGPQSYTGFYIDDWKLDGTTAQPVDPSVEIFTSVTYNQLQNLILNSSLVPGMLYEVNDFQTIHRISGTTDINTGSVEPMVSMATSPTTLSKSARSLTYPNDVIEIDWTNNLAEDGVTPRKGWITYRHDLVRNVSCFYDFRQVKYRRWQFFGFDHETGFVATTPTEITLTLTWSANLPASLTTYRKWEVRFPAGIVHDAGTINLTITKGGTSHTKPLLSGYTLENNWTANQLASLVGPIIYSPELDSYILMNLFDIGSGFDGYALARAGTAYGVGNGLRINPGAGFSDILTFYVNYDSGLINNVHLGPGCNNNIFLSQVYNFTLGGYSSNNTFLGAIATSSIGGESNNNLLLGGLSWCDLGGEFNNNVIGWNANYMSIEGYSINNNFLPGGFNFNAPYTYMWNSTLYCFGWGYVFRGSSVESSFIALTGSNRSDVSFDKEVQSSIVGLFSADNLSVRKRLNSAYIHSAPAASDHFESVNVQSLPSPTGEIEVLGRDEDGNIVGTGKLSSNGLEGAGGKLYLFYNY